VLSRGSAVGSSSAAAAIVGSSSSVRTRGASVRIDLAPLPPLGPATFPSPPLARPRSRAPAAPVGDELPQPVGVEVGEQLDGEDDGEGEVEQVEEVLQADAPHLKVQAALQLRLRNGGDEVLWRRG
jgi:hypothetical protein